MDGTEIKFIKIGSDTVSIFSGYDEFLGYKGPNLTYIDRDASCWYSIDEDKLMKFAETYREELSLDEETSIYKTAVSKKK